MKLKTRLTIQLPENTTPSDDDSVPDDDSTPDIKISGGDEAQGQATSYAYEEDEKTGNIDKGSKASLRAGKNVTGNPILILFLVILTLIIPRRNRK